MSSPCSTLLFRILSTSLALVSTALPTQHQEPLPLPAFNINRNCLFNTTATDPTITETQVTNTLPTPTIFAQQHFTITPDPVSAAVVAALEPELEIGEWLPKIASRPNPAEGMLIPTPTSTADGTAKYMRKKPLMSRQQQVDVQGPDGTLVPLDANPNPGPTLQDIPAYPEIYPDTFPISKKPIDENPHGLNSPYEGQLREDAQTINPNAPSRRRRTFEDREMDAPSLQHQKRWAFKARSPHGGGGKASSDGVRSAANVASTSGFKWYYVVPPILSEILLVAVWVYFRRC